jgi:hypothetical protein
MRRFLTYRERMKRVFCRTLSRASIETIMATNFEGV